MTLRASEEMSQWVIDVNNHRNAQIQEEQCRKKRSIYKLPLHLISDGKKRAYRPQVVSFGPYHYGEPHLFPMEDHKLRALHHFLDRSPVSLDTIFYSIVKVVQELKDSYDSLEPMWEDNTEKFVQLMIMDGCFMLELLRVAYQPENYYSNRDPLFGQLRYIYVVSLIRADMLLLENQLPMLLLLKLRGILENDEPDIEDLNKRKLHIEALNKDILRFLDYDVDKYSDMGECLHVLDLNRNGLLHTHNEHGDAAPRSANQGEENNKGVGHHVVRPATKLHEAGVRFMKSESKSIRDITFCDGVLKLPNFIVDRYTGSMFLNLIAFEHCYIRAGRDISSFVAFMDRIINDSWDIKLLRSKGIVDNFIVSDTEAADLFHTMSEDLIVEMTGNLGQVYQNLINYPNTPWHNCLSKLADKSCKQELANGEMPMLNNPGNGQTQEEQLWWMKPSIYKVPPFISNINKTAYQPRVVSFGPYHHGEPDLASMEAHKERILLRYFRRSKLPMQEVFNFVAQMAEELKDSYDSLDSKWQDNTERFVQMMILDACFMLEILSGSRPDSKDNPLFTSHENLNVMPFIKADMLLLENQLPMSLLLWLKCNAENSKSDIKDLIRDILSFLSNREISNDEEMDKCCHVLHVYHKSLIRKENEHRNEGEDNCKRLLHTQGEGRNKEVGHDVARPGTELPQPDIHSMESESKSRPDSTVDDGHKLNFGCKRLLHTPEGKNKEVGHDVVRPATELHEAGIHFKGSKSKSLQDITFHDGVLRLPKFIVSDRTESTFLNLIAFERCHTGAGCDITSFIWFMDRIIDDNRDIKLLSSKGIIENYIGSDKEAADLFNTMSKDLDMIVDKNVSFYTTYNKIITYSNTPWHEWRASLCHTYCRCPWKIISLIVAFLILFLTTLQTIFTIRN